MRKGEEKGKINTKKEIIKANGLQGIRKTTCPEREKKYPFQKGWGGGAEENKYRFRSET
jgi:hypothetical protein